MRSPPTLPPPPPQAILNYTRMYCQLYFPMKIQISKYLLGFLSNLVWILQQTCSLEQKFLLKGPLTRCDFYIFNLSYYAGISEFESSCVQLIASRERTLKDSHTNEYLRQQLLVLGEICYLLSYIHCSTCCFDDSIGRIFSNLSQGFL